MNYKAIYDRLIDRARSRVLDGYSERHHVIPKCLGGTNAAINLVRLTAEEHYVAHQLLVKLHPGHLGLIMAAYAMTLGSTKQRAANNKLYGWLRRRHSQATIGCKRPPEVGAAIAAARRGMKFTPEHRENMSRSRKGWKRPAEATEKIAQKLRGRKRDPEVCARISASKKGKHTGKVAWNKGIKGAYSSPRKGKPGKRHSEETRAKMSASHLARRGLPRKARAKQSPEAIEKRAASIRASYARRRAAAASQQHSLVDLWDQAA